MNQQEAKSFSLFHADSRSDADDEQKRKALDEWNAVRPICEPLAISAAAFFNSKPKDREELKQIYWRQLFRTALLTLWRMSLASPWSY